MEMNEELEKLARLEEVSRQLEPTAAERLDWANQAVRYINDFVEGLPNGQTFLPDTDHGKALRSLPFQDAPRAFSTLLQAVDIGVTGNGINPSSGGHLGYVPGGGLFPSALGDFLAAGTNRYAGVFFTNPGAVRMENDLIRWMCSLVGYPDSALGNLSSGGSIANLIALTTAREHLGLRSADFPKAVVYLSGQTHHCVQKALRIAGMGECVIRYIPTDARFALRAEVLQQTVAQDIQAGLKPFLMVGSAGTTNTGTIDPLDAMADIAAASGCWFHVDAAYGGFFRMVEAMKPLFKGIERSDSVAIDPHKGLFLPYGLGAVLIRNVEAQFKAHFYTASYLQDAMDNEEELSPADLSPELTRHFRGMRMWLPLQSLGLAPFRAALEEKIRLAHYAYHRLQAIGFETGPFPDLSIFVFRYVPASGDANRFNEALIQYIQDDGRVYLSSTRIGDTYWIRMAVLSFRTHRREIDLCLDVLQAGVRSIAEA